MKAHGKKYRAAATKVAAGTAYAPKAALEIVKGAAFAKFDETVEIAVRLGVDPRHADQAVRGTVVLPAGTGKPVRVLVILLQQVPGKQPERKQHPDRAHEQKKRYSLHRGLLGDNARAV